MFTHDYTKEDIHANLDQSASHGTMRRQDLIPVFLNVIRETPEYIQYMAADIPPAHANEDDQADWWDSEEAMELLDELFTILDNYAPGGYYFGAHPGDGSDYGYWKAEEEENDEGENHQQQFGLKSELDQFTGTQDYHRTSFLPVVVTDGVKYLADKANAYWLIDAIGSYTNLITEFGAAKLTVRDHKAELRIEDGNDNLLANQKIDFTDFPLDEITLFLGRASFPRAGNVLVVCLPSEY